MTIYKQLGQIRSTKATLLWILIDQDSLHDIINVRKMANKIDLCQKNGPRRSLRQIHANATTTSTCIGIV